MPRFIPLGIIACSLLLRAPFAIAGESTALPLARRLADALNGIVESAARPTAPAGAGAERLEVLLREMDEAVTSSFKRLRFDVVETRGPVLVTSRRGQPFPDEPVAAALARLGGDWPASAGVVHHIGGATDEWPALAHVVFADSATGGPAGRFRCVSAPIADLWNEELKDIVDSEAALLLDGEGRVLFRHGARAGRAPETHYLSRDARFSRQQVARAIRAQPRGRDGYAELTEDPLDLIWHDVEWAHVALPGNSWVVVTDRQGAFAGDEDHPLSGRWTGAFTLRVQEPSQDGREVREEKGGGQLNVLIYQDGAQCTVGAVGAMHPVLAHGVIAGSSISAAELRINPGGGMAVWYWQGQYDQEKDSISGVLSGNASDAVITKSYFLKRAVPAGPAPASKELPHAR